MVNRLAEPAPVSPAPVARGLALRAKPTTSDADAHLFFAPLHYEPRYAYPLLVWLHGPDDNETQLRRVMPLVSVRNYVAVGVRGTLATDESGGEIGYRWVQSADHFLLAEHRVLRAIAAAKARFNLHPSRIVLAGYGCGGTMAQRIALMNPQLAAGAASLGGPFPQSDAPLRRWHDRRRVRLLVASSQCSREYAPQDVVRDLRLFHAANLVVHLRHYPGGDELTTAMLADLDRWIMNELVLSPADAAAADPCQR